MLNTYGDISPRTAAFAAKMLLARGKPLMIIERFGQFDPQGKNKTKTRKYRRYESLARATAPLAEGVSPAGQALSYTDVTVTLEQFGDVVKLTDVIQDTHEDPVLDEMMTLVGEQSAETIEVTRILILKGGTSVTYADGVASRSLVNGVLTRGQIRKMVRTFKRNRAKKITKIIKASMRISTEPVAPSFPVIAHTDTEPDVLDINGFVPYEQYSDSGQQISEAEVGKVEGCRFFLTDLVEPWSQAGLAGTKYLSGGSSVDANTACDVYPMLFIGRDSYGLVPLAGSNAIKPIVQNPNVSRGGDLLGQQGGVGWKTMQATIILNQLWIQRYETAATAEPE